MENKFRAYLTEEKKYADLVQVDSDGEWHAFCYEDGACSEYLVSTADCLEEGTGLKDTNGKEIYYDSDRVRFMYEYRHGEYLILTGTFHFNEEELRAEIDIDPNNHDYVVLWYDSERMTELEIIGNIH